MKNKQTFRFVLWIVLFVTGYLAGVFFNPQMSRQKNTDPHHVSIEMGELFTQRITDLQSETPISSDTLFAHERNLLVFWSPTCKFCQQFFRNHLNQEKVGIFCFPITDDLEYARYFVEKNEIQYPQLVVKDSIEIHSVSMPTIEAVPTFVVLNNDGNVLYQTIGIKSFDSLLENLY